MCIKYRGPFTKKFSIGGAMAPARLPLAPSLMAFKVTVALRARRVEKWIRGVKRDFLDAATTKCVGFSPACIVPVGKPGLDPVTGRD
jgi:hypothetical protein